MILPEAVLKMIPVLDSYDVSGMDPVVVHGWMVAMAQELLEYRTAVAHHHAQRGNDKCWENDNDLYAKFGLEPHDKNDLVTWAEHCRNCDKYRIGIYCVSGEAGQYDD